MYRQNTQEQVNQDNSDDSQIDRKKLHLLISEAFHATKSISGQDIVLVLGNTGAGKSTMINYLLGCPMAEEESDDGGVNIVVKEGKEKAKIGHQLQSTTLYPEAFLSPHNFYYCDFPGFGETRSTEHAITTAIATKLAINFAKQVRGIIITIEHADFIAGKSRGLREAFQTLHWFFSKSNAIKYPLDAERLSTLLIFAITKGVPKVNYNKLLANTKKQAEANLNSDLAFMCTLALLDESRIILMDPLDDGSSSKRLVHLLKTSKPLLPDVFGLPADPLTKKELMAFLMNFTQRASQTLETITVIPNEIQSLMKEKCAIQSELSAIEQAKKNYQEHRENKALKLKLLNDKKAAFFKRIDACNESLRAKEFRLGNEKKYLITEINTFILVARIANISEASEHSPIRMFLDMLQTHSNSVPNFIAMLQAEYDNKLSQCCLGVCYEEGLGVEPSYKNAVYHYKISAEKGYAPAQYRLGLCYENGFGVLRSGREALSLYNAAAAYLAEAQKSLERLAIKYETESEQGNVLAQINLGLCYKNGYHFKKNLAHAVRLFSEAAVFSNGMAEFELGLCYETGEEIKQDIIQALRYYQRAKMQGHIYASSNGMAEFELGLCYETGEGIKQDIIQALRYYQRAKMQGHIYAGQRQEQLIEKIRLKNLIDDKKHIEYCLGVCYEDGLGVEPSYKNAVYHYKISAEKGYAPAQYCLGLCYENGFGVSYSEMRAIALYDAAAAHLAEAQKSLARLITKYKTESEQGNVLAQINLGLCYKNGYFFEKNTAHAVRLFSEAAVSSNSDGMAEFELGLCYETGEGVKQDIIQALRYYQRARMQGHIYAGQRQEQLIEKIRLNLIDDKKHAEYCLGICYQEGLGVPFSPKNAVYHYKISAKKGYAPAQYRLGLCYENGFGVPYSEMRAIALYDAAAAHLAEAQKSLARLITKYKTESEQGNVLAQINLGLCHKNGYFFEKNTAHAVRLFSEAAVSSNSNGMAEFELGLCYETGEGVKQDIIEALCYYQRAKLQGCDRAATQQDQLIYNLKLNEAITLCKRSAKQHHSAPAYFKLSQCYENGWGGHPNSKKSKQMLKKASQYGFAEASYMLGHRYEYGAQGYKKRLARATFFYSKAEAEGYPDSSEGVERCSGQDNHVKRCIIS